MIRRRLTMPPPLKAAAGLGITCRPMAETDLPFVEALYASTRAEEVALTGWPPEQQKAFLAQQHRAQHNHYRVSYATAEWLIVEREGEPIGRLYLDEREDRVRIIDISLVPAARGRGIGGVLLADIIAAAEDCGLGVTLHVEVNNPARRLYERLGFRPVEDKGVYLRLDRAAGGLSMPSPGRTEVPARPEVGDQ
jgi:RimJ/RimL family protein N-acetyltransferase